MTVNQDDELTALRAQRMNELQSQIQQQAAKQLEAEEQAQQQATETLPESMPFFVVTYRPKLVPDSPASHSLNPSESNPSRLILPPW